MRFLSFAAIAAALCIAAPASAQSADAPSPESTFVATSESGEAVRVTTYDRRPPEQGRLARRFKGIRVNRAARAEMPLVRPQPVARTFSTPRYDFVRRGGSHFQVLPAR